MPLSFKEKGVNNLRSIAHRIPAAILFSTSPLANCLSRRFCPGAQLAKKIKGANSMAVEKFRGGLLHQQGLAGVNR